jgi:hypothetical protein
MNLRIIIPLSLPLSSPSLHHKPSQKKFANGDGIV